MYKKLNELAKVSKGKLILYTILSIVAGLTGLFFISLVNKVIAELIAGNDLSIIYLIDFGIILAVFIISKRVMAGGIINLSQELHWNVRKDVADDVLKAPYSVVKEKQDKIYSTLTADVANIVHGSLALIQLASSFILILACFLYMGFLSYKLFAICLLINVFGIVAYLLGAKKNSSRLNKSRDLERNYMDNFDAILSGIKEIKVNPIIGDKIYTKLNSVVDEAKENDIKAFTGYLNAEIITQILYYALVFFVLFYAGSFFDVQLETTISFVFVLLFLMGPVSAIAAMVPVLKRTTISVNRLVELKSDLRDVVANEDDLIEKIDHSLDFEKLEFKECSFSYGEDKFSIGPLNFEINKGDVVFIYGGNGSGKTTLLNLILNINRPKTGEIVLNNKILDKEKPLKYNVLFSPVFSDFYLFDELYGVETVDIDMANEYIELFELTDKVKIEDNKFSTLDLSTGQRKRLALINALIENKPLIILDEWAADQDPVFRKKFYREIIPYLSSKGFTLLLITHDDKYYDTADKLFKMEYGSVINVNETSEIS